MHKIIIKRKYNYQDYQRIDGEQRLYVTPSGNLPSVTTILSATQPEKKRQVLENWRNRVGQENAKNIVEEASAIGSLMHENLENYMDGLPPHGGNMPIRVLARRMADVIIENAYPKIEEVYGQEVKLYYPGLWAGTTDLVGTFNGVFSIMDYKNSRSVKKKEHIDDYILQGAAYAIAHDNMFGTNIQQTVILVCCRKDEKNLQYQEFIIKGDEFQQSKIDWLKRVDQYHRENK